MNKELVSQGNEQNDFLGNRTLKERIAIYTTLGSFGLLGPWIGVLTELCKGNFETAAIAGCATAVGSLAVGYGVIKGVSRLGEHFQNKQANS